MAAEYAANAFTERQQNCTNSEMFDPMIEMSDKLESETASAMRYKKKYREAKRSGASQSKLSEIERRYKRVKKKVKMYEMQYNKLKSDLGYESPEESDGSLLSKRSNKEKEGCSDSDSSCST
jgi:archaellum component FlaC